MRQHNHTGEEGYLLLGLTVMVFVLLVAMAVAAPIIAKDLERERELRSAEYAREYVRAIQLYYRKSGNYPTSIDQLKESNTIHFLRRDYKDPLTGKEYRLILVGQNQTQVKGFFGEPLAGLQTSSGGASGVTGGLTSGQTTGGLQSSFNSGTTTGSSGGLTSSFNNGSGTTGTSGTGTAGASGQTGSVGGTNASDFSGGNLGPIMGVGTSKTGKSIYNQNGEEDFAKWEFLYDPRVDQLKAKVNILGGGVSSGNATDLSGAKSTSIDSLNGSSSSSGSSSSGSSSTSTQTK